MSHFTFKMMQQFILYSKFQFLVKIVYKQTTSLSIAQVSPTRDPE